MKLNSEELGDLISRFLRELEWERYSAYSGEKGTLDTSRVFRQFGELFDVFVLAELEEEWSRETGVLRRRAALSYRYLLSKYPGSRTSGLSDRLFWEMVDGGVTLDGRRLPIPLMDSHLAQVADREKRSSLYRSRGDLVQELNPLMGRRMEGIQGACEELGFPDLITLSLRAADTDISWITDMVNLILERTEGVYLERMDEIVAREVGPSIERVEKHDMLHLLRGTEHDSLFSNRDLATSVESLIGGLALDSMDSDISFSIIHDCMPLPGAYTFSMGIPEEIRTIMRPCGGYNDFVDLFGAVGASAYLGSISGSLPSEFRYLGDPAMRVGYAGLFRGILGSRAWIGGKGGGEGEEIGRFLELFYVRRVYELRRHASLLSYELRMLSTTPEDAPGLFKTTMDDHLHISHDPKDYLIDIMNPLSSVVRIKAFILEGMLRTTLEEKFGEVWFLNPLSSRFLGEIWSYGGRYDLREVANYLGFADLDPEPMLEGLEDSLHAL